MGTIVHPPTNLTCVVDSDDAVLDGLEAFIQTLGQPVQTFADAHALQQQWQALRPRRILCAAELQDGSGVDLFRWLQANELEVSFGLSVSAHQRALIKAAKEAGIEYIFHKPLLQTDALMRFLQGMHV